MTLNEAKAVIYGNVVYACEKAGLAPQTTRLVQDACDTVIALADRKTENCSVFPNNCEDEPQTDCYMCKWLGDVNVCGRCRDRNLFAEADTEPQTDIHDLTDCDFCKDRNCKDCEGGKDEPQTERSE